jgi:predicted membrane protein
MVDFERRPITVKTSANAGFRLNIGVAGPGMFVGLLLVVLGTLLFIDNLDLLPFSVAKAFWPLAILAYCGITFFRTCSPIVRVWTVTGMVWGALLLLNDVHLIHVRGDILWPLILIASGVVLLLYRLRWQTIPWKEWTDRFSIASNAKTNLTSGKLEEYAVFSGVKRRIETLGLEGGHLTSVFGSLEIDLRKASISAIERQAVIEANAAFGAIELRIPETWRVDLRGNAVFGAYEDKTIPPRPDPGSLTPTLVIRGGTAFGAVVIKN